MPTYTLHARNHRTLSHGGKEYRDGDQITLAKSEAEKLALEFNAFRFEPKDGGAEISTASIDADTAPTPKPASKP